MNSESITDHAIAQFQWQDPRSGALMAALVLHLHGFARETNLSHAEWRMALRFLTEMGAITDDARNEFSLLSDVLGLSSLVDLLHSAPGATPGSVLGPFHVHDSRPRDTGVDLAVGQAGIPTLFLGSVRNHEGQALLAEVDFWQNADNGMYPQQDAAQDPHNLRCKLRTDAQGCFSLRTVQPKPYSVPTDGPVGALLRAGKRHCMRPAHFHLIVSAQGYLPVTTEIFWAEDPYLDSDAVFGVRPNLVVTPESCTDAAVAAREGMPSPFTRVRYDFRLALAPGPHRSP